MEDHGRFYPKAQDLSKPLYHNDCGTMLTYGDSYPASYYCRGCGTRWMERVMRKFTADDLALRFHNRPVDFDPEAVTFVDITEKGKTFTSLVPVTEAHKYKKAKL